MNKKVLLKVLKYIASLGLAFGILYLLFKNQDPVRLVEEIQKVNGKWVVLSMIFGGWAYVSRGLRWIVLIDALGYKSSKWNSISAVSVGYFTNMFIPRAGEISRCTALNQTEKIPVDKLFGTILVERVLDLIFLLFLILLIIVLKFNDIFNFYNALQNQQDVSAENSNLYLLFAIIAVLVISFIFFKNGLKNHLFMIKS